MVTYREEKARILAYTREPSQEDYPEGLAYSVHFAYSRDGACYHALHQNYGILFAEAEISAEDTIVPKGVKNPRLFRLPEGYYGILADRTGKDGNDGNLEADNARAVGGPEANGSRESGSPEAEDVQADESRQENFAGYALLWKTKDFREFDKPVLLEKKGAEWEALWEAAGKSVQEPDVVGSEQTGCVAEGEQVTYMVDGEQVTGSSIEISSTFCDLIVQKWTQVHHTENRLPDEVYASKAEDLEALKALAVYSDGSTALKKVLWNTEAVNFTVPGTYQVTGKVCSRKFPFPLAKGYGDPVIFAWEGKWYFLGTNDNLNDIGIYVREADSAEGLFAEGAEEHLILGVDEEKGFVQTFWAPEFHVIGGRLYILFAVGGKMWSPQCHMMRLKEGGHIVSPDSWEEPVKVVRADGSPLSADGITLDMTYLSAGGRAYMVWSYRRGIGTPKDTGSMLCIAEIEEAEPWKLAGEPVLLSRPLFGWENVSGTINNEGPYGFKKDGKVYLTYSGGAANGYTYALGLLTADEDADLTDPGVWKKSGFPVLSFCSVKGEYGPGHNSFFIDEDGSLMIAYHGETSLESHLRCDGIRRIHFDIQGEPVFDMSPERDLNPAMEEVSLRVIVSQKAYKG